MTASTKFRRGTAGYAMILAALYRRHQSIREVATAFHMRHDHKVRLAIREMHTAGLVHIASWRQCGPTGGSPNALWAVGNRADASATLPGAKMPLRATRTRPEMLAFIAAVRCMQDGPSITSDIAAVSGLHLSTTQALIRTMRALGLVHIGAYERPGNTLAAAYSFGRGKDAPRPQRMTQREIEQRAWAKRKARRQQVTILLALTKVTA